ncbi:MAG: hypothetical protein GYA24_20640 [Candidatus Lokiarchaeota archaeon]|nr:hypothetical protein [Candidatus Lokiarchaeota archaeon]
MSSEYYPVTLEVPDLGTAKAKLMRSAAPLTVKHIYQLLQAKPFASRARWNDPEKKEAFVFEIGIQKGKEGKPGPLHARDIGYSYRTDSIAVFLADASLEAVKIGEIVENLDLLRNFKNGMSVKLKLA